MGQKVEATLGVSQVIDTQYKRNALQAAKDFGYGAVVIEKIKAAKSDHEISRIMMTARVNGGR